VRNYLLAILFIAAVIFMVRDPYPTTVHLIIADNLASAKIEGITLNSEDTIVIIDDTPFEVVHSGENFIVLSGNIKSLEGGTYSAEYRNNVLSLVGEK